MTILEKMEADMMRLKAYFPYRIVWGAISPDGNEFVTGATPTKRQVNDYLRKGWHTYVIS